MVDGFIPESKNQCIKAVIPKDICIICNEYLFEVWDTFSRKKSSSAVRISRDGLTFRHSNNRNRYGNQCVFGTELIDSMNNKMIYSWKFKFIARNKKMYFPIGICKDYEYDRNRDGNGFDKAVQANSYYFNSSSSSSRAN